MPMPKIGESQIRIWICLKILSILLIWNFKFNLQEGSILWKQQLSALTNPACKELKVDSFEFSNKNF